jgi:hypothetical protein
LASCLVPNLLAVIFSQSTLSKRDTESLLDLNYHDLTIYRRLARKDHFVSGRILKEKKTMGDNNARLFTGALEYGTLSVVIAARIALAKNDPGPVSHQRLGTHPPEHVFGHFRMMSRDQHLWMKLDAIVQKDLLLKAFQPVVGAHHGK